MLKYTAIYVERDGDERKSYQSCSNVTFQNWSNAKKKKEKSFISLWSEAHCCAYNAKNGVSFLSTAKHI